MLPNMPALGIRFDIDKLESGAYGIAGWKVFWRAIDVERLAGGTLLFEGDTALTLNGFENVYCIVVQSMSRTLLSQIRSALEQSAEFQRVAASPRFIEGASAIGEPLPEAGGVDATGNLVGEQAWNPRTALGSVRREKRAAAPAAEVSLAVPERRKPASQRTANLPMLSSLEKLESFLEKNFVRPPQTVFYCVTPEELCDIMERYESIIQAHWIQDSCGISEDMVYINLFEKGKTGDNLEFIGLFLFASSSDAMQYCRQNHIDPSIWGIEGKYALNFMRAISNEADDDWYEKYFKDAKVDATTLWAKICKRRAELGVGGISSTEDSR